jgi:hypothetical protein
VRALDFLGVAVAAAAAAGLGRRAARVGGGSKGRLGDLARVGPAGEVLARDGELLGGLGLFRPRLGQQRLQRAEFYKTKKK